MDVAKGSSLGSFMKQIRKKGHAKDSIHLINSNIDFTVYFYSKKDCLKGNYSDVLPHNDNSLTIGSYILTQQYEREVDVNKLFMLQSILRYKECSYYKILGKK